MCASATARRCGDLGIELGLALLLLVGLDLEGLVQLHWRLLVTPQVYAACDPGLLGIHVDADADPPAPCLAGDPLDRGADRADRRGPLAGLQNELGSGLAAQPEQRRRAEDRRSRPRDRVPQLRCDRVRVPL